MGNDTLTGTSSADTITGRNGNDRIYGLGGNDNIDGGKGNDYIDGGAGNDRLDGNEGDDILIGGAGNDYIDGGPHGHDVARYSGNFADYQITRTGGSGCDEGYVITVRDTRNIANNDGTDTLRRIETIQFANGEYRDGHFISNNNPATISGTATGGLAEDSGSYAAGGTLTVSDADAGQNVFQIPSSLVGIYGSFSFNPTSGAWSYTLNNSSAAVQSLAANQTMHDRLTVTSADGTASQIIDVTITGTNDVAVIAGAAAGAVVEAGGINNGTPGTSTAGGTLTVSDADAGQNVFQTPSNLSGTYGGFTFNAASGVWGYTLNNTNTATQSLTANQTVHDMLTVTSADGTATQVIDVTITGTNDAAVIGGTASMSLTESNLAQVTGGTLTVTDVDNPSTFVGQNNVAGSNGYGKFTIGTNGVWTYTMNSAHDEFVAGTTYTDRITVATADGTTQVLTVSMLGTNDAAAISGTTSTNLTETNAAQSTGGTLAATDADSSNAFVAQTNAVGSGGYGKFTIDAAGAWSYTMNSAHDEFVRGTTYTDKITVATADGTTQVLTVSMLGTNDAPVAPSQTVQATEGGAIVTANALATFSDVDGGVGSPSAINVPAPALLPAGVSYNAGTHVFTFNPTTTAYDALAQGEQLPLTVNYSVSDGITSTPTSVTFNVTGANDKPILTAPALIDADTTLPDAGRAVTGQLSASDVDHGATQTYSVSGSAASTLPGYDLASVGAFGTLYLNSTNGSYSFIYTAAVDRLYLPTNVGDDSFMVTVSDGLGGTDSKPLTVHLTGTNDAPVISGVVPFNYTVTEAAKVVAPDLKLSDPDSNIVTSATVAVSTGFTTDDVLSLDAGTLKPGMSYTYDANGLLTITGNGTLAEYRQILDSVTFQATDPGQGGRVIAFTVFDNSDPIHPVQSATAYTSNLSLLDLSTSGFRLPGVTGGDASGFSVSTAGDVNGDGYADMIIGAPWVSLNGESAGSSYVVYGKSSGFAIDTPFGPELPLSTLLGATGFSISGQNAYDRTAISVRNAGDVNGDGFGDVIIGAPYANPLVAGEIGWDQAGASYVVFGHAANPLVADTNVTSLVGNTGFSVSGAGVADWAGYSVSGAGDVNGDGFADVIIGAPHSSHSGLLNGAAFVVFGHAGVFETTDSSDNGDGKVDLAHLSSVSGFSMTGASAADWTGVSVSAAGDVNGDGIGDVIIGNATPLGLPASVTGYVVFGTTLGFGESVDLSTLGGMNGFSLTGAGTGLLSGGGRGHYSVHGAGDVNGDGFGDVIIGAPYASAIHGQTGAAYVLFGKAGGFDASVDLANLAATDTTPAQGFEIIGVSADDRAGYSVSGAGDVNGDGYGDLIVGAPNANDGAGNPAGTSYVIFGKAAGFDTIDLANLGNDGFAISAVGPRNDSGYAVSAAGDINGDGFADLIVGSSGASPHTGAYAGESYVIFGAKFITTPNTQVGSDMPGDSTTFSDGTTLDDIFVAGQGNATMVGGGGNDSFSGGVGNDTIHIGAAGSNDSSFLKIDGGGGHNSLVLDGSGMTLDLTVPSVDSRIHNIDHIDLGASGNNTLALNIHDVLNMSDSSNSLQVGGTAGDVVNVATDAGWAQGADQTIGLVAYHSYTQGMASLLIDPTVTVHFI